MKLSPEELRQEIKRRAPWYQHIHFPDQDINTTDDPADAMLDAAWDNKIGDISLEEAARLRPTPKWKWLQPIIPAVTGLDVLEIGSNCGFFSFAFADAGAKSVLGLDVAEPWLQNAEWARTILGHDNVRFQHCDFMRYAGPDHDNRGLLNSEDSSVPLPDNMFDLVFMSTVLDHLFFPLFAIYKMMRISRKWVVIDVPTAPQIPHEESLSRFGVAPDKSHHGFTFTPAYLQNYIGRLGVPEQDITTHIYNEGLSACYLINVARMADGLKGC